MRRRRRNCADRAVRTACRSRSASFSPCSPSDALSAVALAPVRPARTLASCRRLPYCAPKHSTCTEASSDRGLCYVGIGLFNSNAPEWVGPSFIAIAIVGLLYMLTSLLMSCQGYSVRQKAEKEKEARDMQQAIAMAHALGPQGWSGPPSGWNGAPQQAYPAQKPPSTSPYSGYGHRASEKWM